MVQGKGGIPLIRSYSSEEEVDTRDRNEPLGGGWNDKEEDPRGSTRDILNDVARGKWYLMHMFT